MASSGTRTALKIMIGILLVTGCAFFLLEGLLFLFEDQVFHNSFYVFDSDLGFRVRPYAIYGNDQANRYGFNDRDYPEERKPGTFRILFLGDSFNWMGGQAENYTAVLEALFESRFGPGRIEVISAGYSMTHTGEQVALLKKFGLRYQPDLVILGFFAGNDFYDALPNRRRIVYAGVPTDVFHNRDFFAVVLGRPFLLRSRLVSFVKAFTEYQAAWWEHGADLLPPPQRRSDATIEEFPRVLGQKALQSPPPFSEPSPNYAATLRLQYEFCDPRREAQFRANVDSIEESIRELAAILRERDIRFILSVFPDRVQIDERLRVFLAQSQQREPSSFGWNRAQELLSDLCSKQELEYFDLTGDFLRAHRDGWRLYISNDTHWNRDGNRLAAELFYLRLVDSVDEYLTESR
jgi:lysophospholipase L1-like esterase